MRSLRIRHSSSFSALPTRSGVDRVLGITAGFERLPAQSNRSA